MCALPPGRVPYPHMLRLPLTLWMRTTVELWRLLLLSTGMLVAVISFAVTIGPLADGQLSPIDALRFMLFASVPMLAYALPFGAGFAATLVYHRMGHDNELTAAYAGGIGHDRLLVPAIATGIVLAATVGALSDQLIPRFLRSMEQMITEDVARLMVNRLGAGETVEFGGNMIYADAVLPLNKDKPEGAESMIMLRRVAFAKIDRDNALQAIATAELAYIAIFRNGDADRGAGSIVTLVAENYNSSGDGFNAISTDQLRYDFTVPGAFKDDPNFWTLSELRDRRKRPKEFRSVKEWHHRLALRAASLDLLDTINIALHRDGQYTLGTKSGDTVVIHAEGLGITDWLKTPIIPRRTGQPIVIERFPADGGRTERFVAESGIIETEPIEELSARDVSIKITLKHVAAVAESTGEALDRAAAGEQPVTGKRKAQQISGITPKDDLYTTLVSLSLEELLDRTAPMSERGDGFRAVKEARDKAIKKQRKFRNEVLGKMNSRFAMSGACLAMIVLGAVLAIRLRDALPLVVYLWSFFPALATVLAISSGEQFTQQLGWPGLAVIWGAVFAALFYAWVVYRQISLR